MDIRRIGGIKGSENQEVGNRVKVKVVKNKLAPPFQQAEFDIMFNKGISRAGSLVDVGSMLNVIEKKGTWFSFSGQRLGQGREAAKEELEKNAALANEIEKQILAKTAEPGSIKLKTETADSELVGMA